MRDLMNALTHEYYQNWMKTNGKASEQNDPQASASLFAPNAAYYETPFADPLVGLESNRKYWAAGAQKLKDKKSTLQVVSVQAHRGIDRWQSQFTVIKSKNTWHWIACSWSSSTTRDCPNPSANGGIFKNVPLRNGHSLASSENHDENSRIQRH